MGRIFNEEIQVHKYRVRVQSKTQNLKISARSTFIGINNDFLNQRSYNTALKFKHELLQQVSWLLLKDFWLAVFQFLSFILLY